jgi:PAS domain S-box-containing protein
MSLKEQFLPGNVDMINVVRDIDWCKTPLGPIENWPSALRTIVPVMLDNPFGMCVAWGPEFTIIYNHGFRSVLPTPAEGQSLGKNAKDIFAERWPVIEPMFNAVMKGKRARLENLMLPLHDTASACKRVFDFACSPIRKEDGETGGVLITLVESKEQTEPKVEHLLNYNAEQSEVSIPPEGLAEMNLFKFMADTAAEPFILIREDGGFAYLNKSALQMWGYTESEISELKITDIDILHDREKFRELFRRSQKHIIPTFEGIHRTKGGFEYPVEINMGGIQMDDESYVFAIARNISGRKKVENDLLKALDKVAESEKRFKDSVQQAPLGISIFRGPEFITEQANNTYLLIVDKTADEFIGHPIFEALPEVKDVVEPLFKEVVRSGTAFYGNEFKVDLKRMGKVDVAYFNFVYHPLREEDGHISGIMVVAMEVTDMVKAKHLLTESEEHFRHMVMQSPIPMTILKGEKFIIDSANNAMFENVWRRSRENVLGNSLPDVFPELKEQKYPALLNDVFYSGKIHTEKESIAYVEGDDGMKKFYLDFEYAPLFTPGGEVWGIMITVNDVSDKVEARKKVEEAEERLRLATESTEISIWDLDLESRNIIHSPRLAVLFGHDPSTVLTHAEMRGQIHPDDLQNIVEKSFDRAMVTGTYEYEARVIKPSQAISWIRTQGKVFFDENKKPVKVIGTLRDITEEKQHRQVLQESEAKFRLLADSLPQQIWTADPDGNIFYYNQTVYNFTGLTKNQLKKGGWIQIVHPDDRELNIKVWMHSVSTGEDFIIEHRFRRYDGEYRWQLSRAIPQKDAEGNIQMWVGSSTDIQNIKDKEHQKDYFISMASHELKTPLTSIKGYVQLLQSMHQNGEDVFLKSSLKTIDKQIVTLTNLISELLDVSKIKSSGLDFNEEEFELNGLIAEVVDEIKNINPEYELNFKETQKIMVFADRNRIGQVLINLLTNAIKYAPKVKVIMVSSQLKNNTAVVSVEDFGIGINKQDLQKIFERFYRVEGRNEKTFPGFGIGLFIVAEIIKRHNGKIFVESEPGKGSVFSFELPVNI